MTPLAGTIATVTLVCGIGVAAVATSPEPASYREYKMDGAATSQYVRQIAGTDCLRRESSTGVAQRVLVPSGMTFADCTPPPATTTTTTVPAPTTTAPSTTVPAQSGGFVETFDGNSGLERFEYGLWHRGDDAWSVRESWQADHDLACGDPSTQRTVRRSQWQESFYLCRDHLMTAVGDTAPYSVAWFSPRVTFDRAEVSTVSWDVNVTDLGTRQWWEVLIHPDGDGRYNRPKVSVDGTDCRGCATKDWLAGTANLASYGPGSVVVSNGPFGGDVGILVDGVNRWTGDANGGVCRYLGNPAWGMDPEGCASKMVRRTFSITDNRNGTLTINYGGLFVETVAGSLPDRFHVVFKDHNYTPDKDGVPVGHTWHWDNIAVI